MKMATPRELDPAAIFEHVLSSARRDAKSNEELLQQAIKLEHPQARARGILEYVRNVFSEVEIDGFKTISGNPGRHNSVVVVTVGFESYSYSLCLYNITTIFDPATRVLRFEGDAPYLVNRNSFGEISEAEIGHEILRQKLAEFARWSAEAFNQFSKPSI